jgi:hypothetical protein
MTTHNMLKMQNPQSNPPKPDGKTPTPIPFSMTSNLLNNNGFDNFNYADSILNLQKPIFVNKFSIAASAPVNTQLFTYETRHILGASGFNGTTSCPYDLIKTLFSRKLAFDLDLVLVPVKVSDSRVIISAFFDYAFDPIAMNLTDPGAYESDNIEIVMSQSLEEHVIPLPLYWATDMVPSLTKDGLFPVYGPQTTVRFYLKEAFLPNMIQPPSFEVLVFLQIKNIKADGFASNSRPFGGPQQLNWIFN